MAFWEKFNQQTNRVKRLTVWFAFIIALSGLWGVLKAFGVDALDWTIGCSSISSQTERNTIDIQKLIVSDSVDRFWKGNRRVRDSTATDKRLRKIEGKLHIESD